MGQIDGYIVADYLLQHAMRARRTAQVPASTWDAVLSHIRNPADADRLAGSAESRLLHRHAIPLLQLAADAGDGDAAEWLAELLADRGDLDQAEQILRAGAGNVERLAELLTQQGRREEADRLRRFGLNPDGSIASE